MRIEKKIIIRQKFKKERNAMPETEVLEKSANAQRIFLESKIYQDALTLMLYMPLGNEVSTFKIIENAFKDGKTVLVPVTDGNTYEISAHKITNDTEFIKGVFSLTEPKDKEQFDKSKIDAVIVPGISFSRNGNRIGFGKGCYDRFLRGLNTTKVGLCYDFQLTDIEPSEFDEEMDYLVTDKEFITCRMEPRNMKELYKKRAEEIVPKFYERKIDVKSSVTFLNDDEAPFGVGVSINPEMQEVLKKGDTITLDFGEHCVGQLSFKMESVEGHIGEPIKIKFRFGEIPMELTRDFSTYNGWISGSWLQEEIVNVDFPGNVTLPRRYCFRYMEVTVLDTVQKVKLSDFSVMHTTSADTENAEKHNIQDSELAKIDAVSAKTLEDCMQSVYEDGPKRDRRLWSGDFRLQALSDYYVFKNYDLVKRCLYLFAACLTDGKYLPSCLYHYPELWSKKGSGFMDYAFLYTVALGEYFEHSKDDKTAKEIFPIVKNQMELTISNLTKDGILTIPEDSNGFIDWADGLKKILPTHGVFLYALEKNIELAKALGENETAKSWELVLEKSRKAAYELFFDGDKFVNKEEDSQYSVHAQVWMILGGVISGGLAIDVLKKSFDSVDSIKPVSPYMHHYVLEAMVKLEMYDEAKSYIKNYWGGMIKLDADTFWEVYVPDDLTVSPYNDAVINSFCHAWSCTPSYFIRKYFNK